MAVEDRIVLKEESPITLTLNIIDALNILGLISRIIHFLEGSILEIL
jgi:hypothetical protein